MKGEHDKKRNLRRFNFNDLQDIMLLSGVAIEDDKILHTINIFGSFLPPDKTYSLQV